MCDPPTRPGPQPCNHIPPTYEAAIRQVLRGGPRVPRPLPETLPALRRLVRGWILANFDEVVDAVVDLAGRVAEVERRLGLHKPRS